MLVPRRWIRYVRNFALCVLAALLVLSAAIQVRERIVRHRAERLLNDIETISLRHTTFDQAISILAGWRGMIRYTVPCSRQIYCNISIGPEATLDYRLAGYPIFSRLYRILGGNVAGYGGGFVVRNGFVWEINYGFEVLAPITFRYQGRLVSSDDSIGVQVETMGGSNVPYYAEGHPDYMILRQNPFSSFSLRLSPYSPRQEIRRLTQFDFSCFTRWLHRCQTQADIVPVLMDEHKKKESAVANEEPSCSVETIRIASREYEDAAIVDVIDNRAESRSSYPDAPRVLKVRLVQRLKRAEYWQPGTEYDVSVNGSLVPAPVDRLSNVRPGDRVILLFAKGMIVGGPHPRVFIGSGECGVVPHNPENLKIVQTGIAEDERVSPLDFYNPNTECLFALKPPLPPGERHLPVFAGLPLN